METLGTPETDTPESDTLESDTLVESDTSESDTPAVDTPATTETRWAPKPHLYVTIFAAWLVALVWFHPRLVRLLDLAHTPFAYGALLFFIVFTEFAWLYGFYNIGVVIFARRYRRKYARNDMARTRLASLPAPAPPVALLYTTCNDFVEVSAESCVAQRYPDYTVYILDDSSDAAFQARVDAFAARYPERVRVVRRPERRGFKAGNLNYALANVATTEPLFALVDADERLPPDFLERMVPRLLANEQCGFVQANHQCTPNAPGSLADAMGVGIDIHWRWYQPLRNRYGFVMLLGHGAVLRRHCWELVGGFPEIVSEDLAFALRIRQHGWRGIFAEDVNCYEEFPESIRAFRVRHMKWTRGTCEFLVKEMRRGLWSRKITLVEKLDVLFPTLSLPLSLFYFLYIVDANLIIATLFGHLRPLTLRFGHSSVVLPIWGLDPHFTTIMSADFFMITLLTFVAPVLCFVIELAGQPGSLFRFLCRSSTVYAALGPMSCFGVLSYLVTGKAKFLVTGDRAAGGQVLDRAPAPPAHGARPDPHQASTASPAARASRLRRWRASVRHLLSGSHPDHPAVQAFEVLCGLVFGATCVAMLQISFFGLAIAFVLLPVLHHVSWEHPVMQRLIYLPFFLILAGLTLGGLGLFGVQPVLFGYGFHF